jgi:citrate synthase
MALELFYPGLVGVCVGETTLLEYGEPPLCRGIPLKELYDQASLSELVFTLWQGDWPNAEELADFESLLVEESVLPKSIDEYLQQVPLHTPFIDLLRTTISMLSHHDDQYSDLNLNAESNKALRVLSRLPLVLSSRNFAQESNLNAFVDSLPTFLNSNLFTPHDPGNERILETLLMVHATRDFDTPAFTARVIASSMGDLYSSIIGALGCLTGLNSYSCYQEWANIIHVLDGQGTDGEPPNLDRLLTIDKPILGYVIDAPQMHVHHDELQAILDELISRQGSDSMLELWEEFDAAFLVQKKMIPSIDALTIRILHLLGMNSENWSVISLFGQLINWAAHALEQRDENIRYQPKLRYRGAQGLHILPNSSMELDDPFPFDQTDE